MSKIEAKYLTKVYKNGAYGLKNCSFSVPSGEFVVVLGTSGSGKSTLLKVLAGTEKLSSGELYLDGILSENIPTLKRNVSMVFQEYVLYPHMTVFDNLATPLKLEGLDEKLIYDRVMDALRVFGLDMMADVKPKNLSGGEQQRVALAKALLKRSKLVLLDEPMSNVDEASRWEYCIVLKKLKQMLPESTFVYVTHNAKEAMLLADRIAVMHNGTILEIAPKDCICSHPQYRLTTELINLPQMTSNSYFDSNGKTLGLSSIEFSFNGVLDENILAFESQRVELSEEYMRRLLYCSSTPRVILSVDKLSKTILSNSFSLVFEVVENKSDYVVLKTGDNHFILNKKTALKEGEKIKLYYKVDDLTLYEGNDRLTCHYPLNRVIDTKILDEQRTKVEVLNKRLKLARPTPRFAKGVLISQGGFELSYKKGRCSIPVVGCLDEEYINGKKINYIAVKGANRYLSVMSDCDMTCFGKAKVWLNIFSDRLEFEERK